MARSATANHRPPPVVGWTHISVTPTPNYQPVARNGLEHVDFTLEARELNQQKKAAGRWTRELWSAELTVRRVLWEVALSVNDEVVEAGKAHGCHRPGSRDVCELFAAYAQEDYFYDDDSDIRPMVMITVPAEQEKKWTKRILEGLARASWMPDLAA